MLRPNLLDVTFCYLEDSGLLSGYICTYVFVRFSSPCSHREMYSPKLNSWITARIKQKGECKCIPWKILRDFILAYPDTKKRVDSFALSIYGLMIFPRSLGYVDEAVSDLFDRLDKQVTPVSVILAETFRSLNACWRAGEGRFIKCAQLLLAWFHSHFWKVDKVSYQVFSENYSPLKEIVATPRRDDISKENWIALL
ncbi:hypothetical protein J1N35_041103 [Gossypium stocksii]|uniref:DUF7745 domain-containing protein n=1 Tax=Gossypium stocksii TaxID=47602 RepID=A0A9D3UEZ7_9ROSI|nr:hypothetical protein J1N35_041103 [Gossypium stocksii]